MAIVQMAGSMMLCMLSLVGVVPCFARGPNIRVENDTESCAGDKVCTHGDSCFPVQEGTCRLSNGNCGKQAECQGVSGFVELDDAVVEPIVVDHPDVPTPRQWTRVEGPALLFEMQSPERKKPVQQEPLTMERKDAATGRKPMMRQHRKREATVSIDVDADGTITRHQQGQGAGGLLEPGTSGTDHAVASTGSGSGQVAGAGAFYQQVRALGEGARTALEKLRSQAQAEENDEITSGKSNTFKARYPALNAFEQADTAIRTGSLTPATLQSLENFESQNADSVEEEDAKGFTVTADDILSLGKAAFGNNFTGEVAEFGHNRSAPANASGLAELRSENQHGTLFDGTVKVGVPDYVVNGELKYCWENNIAQAARNAFTQAMTHIAAHVPCVKFREVGWVGAAEWVWNNGWTRNTGCADANGIQFASSRDGCFFGELINLAAGCQSKGVAVHEILHALGVAHEQKRSDRDTYVRVLWDNVEREPRDMRSQFTTSNDAYRNQGYDFESVMHYGKSFFSRGGDTIAVQPDYAGRVLGNRHGMTTRDTEQLRDQYGCEMKAKKWRLYTTSTQSYGIWDVDEVQFYSDWQCLSFIQGGTPIDSGNAGSGWEARRAFGDGLIWGGRADSTGTFWIGLDFGSDKTVKCIKLKSTSKPATWVGVQMYTTRNQWEQEGPQYTSKQNEWTTLRVVAASDCSDKKGNHGLDGNWYDSDGSTFTCDWYAHATRCSSWGSGYARNGLTANQACCACGGGEKSHCVDAVVTVQTKSWGNEVSWNLVAENPGWWESESGEISAMHGGPYASNSFNTHKACLKAPATYRLEAKDSWGDGWHGGWFQLNNAGRVEVQGSGTTQRYTISMSQ